MKEQNTNETEVMDETIVAETTDSKMDEKEETVVTEEQIIGKEEMPVVPSTITKETAEEFTKEAEFEDAFIRRTITLPGKRKRKEAFKEEETIIGNEDSEIDTYASLKKREYEILSDSAKAVKPKVLYGRIDGIEELEINGMRTASAICHLIADKRSDINTEREITSSIYKIRIPAPMLFIYNREEYATQEGYDELKKNLDMRVGSVVEFIVYDINMAEDEVLASRLRAMQILSYDWYLSDRAAIKPGVLAKGYITYINRKGVVVDVFGSDCFIPNDELAWKFVGDALDEKNLYLGKAVAVRIKSVEKASATVYNRKIPYIKITGSLKDATKNPNEVYFDKYVLGQKYQGVIAYRLVTGEYIVNLGAVQRDKSGNIKNENDRVTCICKAPALEFVGTPYVGQSCSVAIISKDEKMYRIQGAITYLEA